MVTYNNKNLVTHNKLDEIFFNKTIENSIILKEYNSKFFKLNTELEYFLEDLFYVFYKHIVFINKEDTTHCFLLEKILDSIAYKKLNIRTTGSTFETYLVLKYFIDQIFIRLTGTNHIKDISKYYENQTLYSDELSSIKEDFSNILENSFYVDNPPNDLDTLNEMNILKLLIKEKISNSDLEDFIITSEVKKDLIDDLKNIIKEDITYDSFNNYTSFLNNILDNISNYDSKSKSDDLSIKFDNTHQNSDNDSESNHNESTFEDSEFSLLKEYQDSSDNNYENLTDFEDELISKLEEIMENDDISANDFVETLALQIEELTIEKGNEKSDDDGELKNQDSDSNPSDASDNLNDLDSSNTILNQTSSSDFDNPSLDATDESTDKNHIVDAKVDNEAPLFEEIINTIDFLKHSDKKNYIDTNGHSTKDIFKNVINRLENLQAKIILNEKRISKVSKDIKMDSDLSTSLKKLEITLSNVNTLGIAKHSLSALNMDEAIELEKRLRSSDFKRFIDKVGKKKTIASKAKKKKTISKDHIIDKIITSDDMDNIIEDEILQFALDIEEFEWDFYDRLLNKAVLSNQFVSNHGRNKGPIILCYDGSGSMEGPKIEETKAHIIAILDIAKYQNRKVILIQFASKKEALYTKEVSPSYISTKDIYEIYDTFIKGGTDFEKPLKKAMTLLKQENYKEGDILFITDGHCEISHKFINDFNRAKQIRRFKLYSIIIHGHTYSDYGDLGKLSDEVLEIKKSNLNDWNEKISEKIFSII